MTTRKVFGDAGEREVFVEAFKRFEETNGNDGLDPTMKHCTRYKKNFVLPFAQNDRVLMEWMDQPGRTNEKLYRNFVVEAETYLGKKNDVAVAAAAAAKNTKPAPKKEQSKAAAATTKATATPSNAPVAKALFSPHPKLKQNDHDDYEANQDRFDAEYRQTDDELGRGAFATVYKGVKKDNKLVAIKVPHFDRVRGKPHVLFRKAEKAVKEALKEILIWEHLSFEKSPFILELLDSFVVLEKGLPTLKTVAPLAEQGTLEEYIEKFPNGTTRYGGLPENETKIVAKQLLLAHAHMAACDICHRDIKPDNIVIYLDPTTNALHNISVIDLGTAKLFRAGDDNRLQTVCGTDFFHAPEVPSGNYGKDVDIYSCGQTLLVCRFGYYTKEEARQQEDSWHLFWRLEDVYQPDSDPFVEKILQLVETDSEKRSKLDAALESFWHVDFQTEKQSKDFAFAADKLLKLKGLGFLRQKYNTALEQGTATAAIEDLQRQLDAANHQIEQQRTELNAKTDFVQTVQHAMQRLADHDAGNSAADTSLVVPAEATQGLADYDAGNSATDNSLVVPAAISFEV